MDLVVLGVRVDTGSNEVALLLAPLDAPGLDRVLPVAIGPAEGAAIATHEAGILPPRPQTHDLALMLLRAAGAELAAVEIIDLVDGVFFAEVVLTNGSRVDARTSDAVALAVRAEVPIRCREEVFGAAAVLVSPAAGEEEVERFREFLDQVDPEDFGDSDS